MQESLYSYIDPGIIHFMLYPETIEGDGPIAETLEEIAQDEFFSAVEVTWMNGEAREEAKQILKSSQMDVYYGGQPRLLVQDLNLNSFEEAERQKAVETLKDGVDEAIELEAEAIGFLSGKNVEESKKAEAIELLVDSIHQVCEYAKNKDSDLGVVMEVFDYDIDKCALVGPVNVAKEVAEKVDYDNFGLMVDLSHLPLLGESPSESLKPIQEHLEHIHIGNAVLDEDHEAYGDSHPRFGKDVGENGVEELTEFLEILLDIEYLEKGNPKTVSFEVQPLPGESPEMVLANAKRTLKRAWGRLQ